MKALVLGTGAMGYAIVKNVRDSGVATNGVADVTRKFGALGLESRPQNLA